MTAIAHRFGLKENSTGLCLTLNPVGLAKARYGDVRDGDEGGQHVIALRDDSKRLQSLSKVRS